MRVAFVTSEAYPDITADDRLVADAVERRDASVEAAIWSDPGVNWSVFDVVVVRSAWDYHHRADEFRAWIDARDRAAPPIWNSCRVLKWNLEKRYLRDLEAAGVPIVPTEWLGRKTTPDLGRIMSARGWSEVVVKPTISATAFRTFRVRRDEANARQTEVVKMLENGDAMMQPFLETILTEGEWSLVFIDGAFTHAVRKLPRDGDFRVQISFGGSATTEVPSAALVAAAERVLASAPEPWMYARVDGVETAAGFLLLELELLEPALYFSHSPLAVERFAAAIQRSGR